MTGRKPRSWEPRPYLTPSTQQHFGTDRTRWSTVASQAVRRRVTNLPDGMTVEDGASFAYLQHLLSWAVRDALALRTTTRTEFARSLGVDDHDHVLKKLRGARPVTIDDAVVWSRRLGLAGRWMPTDPRHMVPPQPADIRRHRNLAAQPAFRNADVEIPLSRW